MNIGDSNGFLEDVAGELGYTATCLLVDWFGGGTLYVPQSSDDDNHPIAKVIGKPAFVRLVASCGGETIKLPLDLRRETTRRNKLIGALIAKGVGTKRIARIAMLTERQVMSIRAELEDAGLLPLLADPMADVLARFEGEEPANDAAGAADGCKQCRCDCGKSEGKGGKK